jgi:hypothetical protein
MRHATLCFLFRLRRNRRALPRLVGSRRQRAECAAPQFLAGSICRDGNAKKQRERKQPSGIGRANRAERASKGRGPFDAPPKKFTRYAHVICAERHPFIRIKNWCHNQHLKRRLRGSRFCRNYNPFSARSEPNCLTSLL